MTNAPVIPFLRHARIMPVYIVAGQIFLKSRASNDPEGPRRAASLATEARLLPQRLEQCATRPLPIILRWRNFICNAESFRFSVGELIPYLRSLASGTDGETRRTKAIARLLHRLDERTGEVRRYFRGARLAPLSADHLAAILGAPCVVRDQLVIPLRPLTETGMKHVADFSLNGKRYREAACEARSLSDVTAAIEDAMHDHYSELERHNQKAVALLVDFKKTLDRVLSLHRPVHCGFYDELYCDRFHRVQFHRGQSVLVRGPIHVVDTTRHLFVGLPIRGATRAELISPRPTAATMPTAFWTPKGTPNEGGICMGRPLQYRWLHADGLRDAEALVQWLDAAALIASGRAALHRAWRMRSMLPPRSRIRSLLGRRI